MQDSSTLIDLLGGTSAVAQLFEISAASVSEWRRNGIPKARMQTLRLLRPDLFQPTGGQGSSTGDTTQVRPAAGVQ